MNGQHVECLRLHNADSWLVHVFDTKQMMIVDTNQLKPVGAVVIPLYYREEVHMKEAVINTFGHVWRPEEEKEEDIECECGSDTTFRKCCGCMMHDDSRTLHVEEQLNALEELNQRLSSPEYSLHHAIRAAKQSGLLDATEEKRLFVMNQRAKSMLQSIGLSKN